MVQIFVKQLKAGTTIPLDVELSDTVGALKAKIHDKAGIPLSDMNLAFKGKKLTDDDSVLRYISMVSLCRVVSFLTFSFQRMSASPQGNTVASRAAKTRCGSSRAQKE